MSVGLEWCWTHWP